MAEVKWIKITTDMFDNRKVKHLRKLPEGNSIVLIWVMLLTMAGRCNSGGMVFLTENIPYTPKMLADELDFEENTVRLALEALERLGMVVMQDNCFRIVGWEEHQNVDRLREIREYNRLAQQKSRAKRKVLPPVIDMSLTSQRCHATDKEKDKDKELIKEGEDKKDKKDKIVKIDKSDKSLPIPNALTAELVESGYISKDDICIGKYNDIIEDIVDRYSFEIARSCLWYFIKRYRRQSTDENGNEIENKVAYFKTAINNSAERIERDNNTGDFDTDEENEYFTAALARSQRYLQESPKEAKISEVSG